MDYEDHTGEQIDSLTSLASSDRSYVWPRDRTFMCDGLTTPPDAAPNHGAILSVRVDTGYDNGDDGGK